MYKMTYTEKVEKALNENWTIEMCNRYGVDVKDVVRKGKESKELTLELEKDDYNTILKVNGWAKPNNGCVRANCHNFKSANVYRNKANHEWFTAKFSKSETPTNTMTKDELIYWEFVGIATI